MAQFVHQSGIQGVQRLGAVEGDDADFAAFDADFNVFVAQGILQNGGMNICRHYNQDGFVPAVNLGGSVLEKISQPIGRLMVHSWTQET